MRTFSERALREKERMDNEGLKRETYNRVLAHTKFYYDRRRDEILKQQLEYAKGRNALEIGSQCWIKWIEGFGISPGSLECINISEKALQRGEKTAKSSRVRPRFSLMDANSLEFPDDSFDLVFGDAILHHLDFVRALDEISRVLKPGGKIVFCEPLDVNPVGKIVRFLTPKARTRDEQPLRLKEIREIQKRFNTTFFYEQFLSVPFGAVSKLLFSRPDNTLLKSVYYLDRFIDATFPPARMLYRYIIITGLNKKRSVAVVGANGFNAQKNGRARANSSP